MASYADAGVDIDAGEEVVRRIRSHVASTARAGVLGGVGGFGGLFDLAEVTARYRDPLLVQTTDGVGTKALVAAAVGRYDTLGFDLIAMCADDLVCTGAEPLTFLDYVVVGKVDPEMVEAVVEGVAAACRVAGCALVGGETAEHPGQLPDGHLDLAGFCAGAVERDRLLPQRVEAGCVVVGLPSPNLRSNGFSLARKVLGDFTEAAWDGRTIGDVLLEPSVIYTPAILDLLRTVDVRAVAHITGGGMPLKLGRVIPGGLQATIDPSTWEPPRVFDEIARRGRVPADEMRRTFNCGIGMVAVVPSADVGETCRRLEQEGHTARVIGEVEQARSEQRVCWV